MDRIERNQRGAELLPFYVNGTLSAAERAEVEALLAEDDDLRGQLALLKQVRAVMKDQETPCSTGELGLARLMGATRPAAHRLVPIAVAASVAGLALAAVLYQWLDERTPVS